MWGRISTEKQRLVSIGALELSDLGLPGKFDLMSDLIYIDLKVEGFFMFKNHCWQVNDRI